MVPPIENIKVWAESVFNYANSVEKNFPDRYPVLCPVSGFCTLHGPIEKIFMQTNLFWHTGLFAHKTQLVRGPVFCPVSGFCTSDSHIEKNPMKINSYWHINLSLKISGWSGVRFSVRVPVFVLLMVVLEKIEWEIISFEILNANTSDILRGHSLKRIFRLVLFNKS